jgi:hypothetical protein
MGQILIYSADPAATSSQTINLFAQINQSGDEVKFTGSGSTFFGNAVTSYDMVVADGNVQVLANPLINKQLLHFIGSQNLWTGANVGLLGEVATSTISIEVEQPTKTEQV